MKKFLFVLFSFALITSLSFSEDAIYIDHVDGLDSTNPSAIMAEIPLVFYFNYRVETAELTGCTNGKVVYSPEGATWQPVIQNVTPMMYSLMDLIVSTNYFSVDGSGADTIAFSAAAIFGGVPLGYDDFVHTLETKVFAEDVGKTLCIDSTYFPPGGVWLWSTHAGNVFPAWAGPHCFEIVDCCTGMRGDFDYSGQVNVADLVSMVSWLFLGGEAPICEVEANINGIGSAGTPIDAADLSYLVAFLFLGGPPPVACP